MWKHYTPARAKDAHEKGLTLMEVLASIYGLSDAPKAWKDTLVAALEKLGFKQCRYDDCVLVRPGPNGEPQIVVLYVDDLMIFGSTTMEVEGVMKEVMARFDCTEPRYLRAWEPLQFLSHDIQLHRDGRLTVQMSQWLRDSIEKLKEKGVLLGAPKTFSMKPDIYKDLEESEKHLTPEQLTHLRAGVNTLSYCAGAVRWDLLAALGASASGQSPDKGREEHLECLRSTWRYVEGTVDRRLEWRLLPGALKWAVPISGSLNLEAEVDSNFGVARCRSGSLLRWRLGSSDLSWTFAGRSWRQSTVAQSTAEAEITGMSGAGRELMAMRNTMEEIMAPRVFGLNLFGDNSAAILVGSCQAPVRKLRHLTLQQLYIRELTHSGQVQVGQRGTKAMAADALTKVLTEAALRPLLSLMSMV